MELSRFEAGLILFGIIFISVFIFDYGLGKRKYLRKKKKKAKNNEIFELEYLVHKFKLNKDALNLKIILVIISLLNSFIIAMVAITVLVIKGNLILRLLIGFVLLMGLIYALYELLGRYLERSERNGK